MRSLGMLFVFIPVLAMTSLCHGEGTEEENVHYEKLKVLEPMIGTWQMTWADEETGTQGLWELNFSWTPSKRVIAATTKTRRAEKGEDITKKAWLTRNTGWYVWNSESQWIENYHVNQETGLASVSKLSPTGNGAFESEQIRASANTGTSRTTVKCVGDEMHWAFVNRKSPTGEAQKDIFGVFKRVPPSGGDR